MHTPNTQSVGRVILHPYRQPSTALQDPRFCLFGCDPISFCHAAVPCSRTASSSSTAAPLPFLLGLVRTLASGLHYLRTILTDHQVQVHTLRFLQQ